MILTSSLHWIRTTIHCKHTRKHSLQVLLSTLTSADAVPVIEISVVCRRETLVVCDGKAANLCLFCV